MSALVNGMPIVVEGKHPAEAVRLQLDWEDFAEGSPLALSAWVDAAPAAGLTVADDQQSGFRTGVLVSGGTDGATGYIENRVTFSDGRVAVVTFQLVISARVPS